MSENHYHKQIRVAALPADAYRAITQEMASWWTKPQGDLSEIGGVAKLTFPPQASYWTFKTTALAPNERVEFECVDAYHILTDKPESSTTEWLGTKLVFTLIPTGQGTTIEFDHVGLAPQLDCYDVCEEGWDFFFVNSLSAYLNSGVGKPHSAG
ncbi:MAG: SRPBCC domain-containing protein [Pseudomonadota bacterium]